MKLSEAFSDNGRADHVELLKQLPKKIQILLACSYARLALPIWTKYYPNDNRPLTVIETAEGFVLDTHTIEQVRAARDNAYAAASAAYAASTAANDAAYAAYSAASTAAYCVDAVYPAYAAYAASTAANDAAYAAASAAYAGVPWQIIYTLYLHTKGPLPFKQEWKTSDVIALVNGIVQDRAFDRMPILADALQDAGLTDHNVLTHLQQDKCYLSDWTIWTVMNWERD